MVENSDIISTTVASLNANSLSSLAVEFSSCEAVVSESYTFCDRNNVLKIS